MKRKKGPSANTKAKAKYDKKTYKTYLIKIRKDTESNLIEKLESVESKQGYIKNLILNDLKK